MKWNDKTTTLLCLRPIRYAAGILAALFVSAFVHQAAAGTYSLTSAWNIAAGTDGLSTGADAGNRGVAYNALSNQVFVTYRAGGSNLPIMVFDGAAGTWISGSSGVTGSLGLNCDQIGVGDDGVIYACPLNTSVTASSAFKVYSWANWNVSDVLTFSSGASDPIVTAISGTKRVGDTLAVTGAGTNTLILAGVGGSGAFALLSVTNSVVGNFTSTVLTNSTIGTLPNETGICFYTNNTFIVKASGSAYLIQYPTNFASLTSPVATTVLGSVALTGTSGDTFLSYSAAGQLLGAVSEAGGTTSPLLLFSTTNFPAAATSLVSATIATPNANGNSTGGVALGGAGKTNYIYAMETDNGLHAYQIIYNVGAVGPTVTAPVGGITNAYPPQTLSVTTTGTAPLFYQWYSITGSTTNLIAGANTNTYTATTAVTNLYFVVVSNAAASANVVTSSVVGLSLLVPVTNAVVSQLWNVPIGTYAFLANDNDSRGIAYDTNLNVVAVSSTTGGVGVFLLNGNTGVTNGSLSTAGLPSGNQFVIDQIGIADDGLVYGGALDTGASGQLYSLYQWPAATNSAVASVLYTGDPGNGSGDRWGDTMAVRGNGANTQVLLGANASQNVVLFTTPDGTHFSPTLMTISGVPSGFAAKGVAFGAGNTFWAKNYGGDLFEIAFDPVALTNAVLFDYSISGQIPSRLVAVAVDMTNNILAGVNLLDVNNDLQLFELTGSANPPVLFDQSFFPSYNVNGNDNAAVVMKRYGNTNRVYALDADNGLVALTYGVPATQAPSISTAPSSETVFAAGQLLELTVGVSGSLPIYYQWQLNNTNIPNATNSTYTLSNLTTNSSGSYDVVVHNLGGSQTSAPAVVTIEPPVTSPDVTQLWDIAAGGTNYPYQSYNTGLSGALTNYPYLDTTSYAARGLAYDTNTSTVLVANNGASAAGAYLGIYVLDANTGTNEFAMNTLNFPTANLLFTIDQVGVGDDGVVYAANCVAAGSATNFSVFSWPNVSAGAFPSYAMQATDPGNGSGDRWGDSMAVRGAAANTQILLGTYSGFDGGPATNAALLTTVDGVTFTPTLLTITNAAGVPAGFSELGIAFGAGNTFWTLSPGYDLRQIAFDPVTGNCSVLQNISNAISGFSAFANMGSICLDVPNNLLAGIVYGDTPMDVAFYQLGGSGASPYLFDQAFFPIVEANAQHNGATAVKANRVYALDANNGIIALSYTVPPAAPTLTSFSVTSVSNKVGTGVTLSWQSIPEFSYQVQTASTLSGTTTWVNLGSPIVATGSTTSYTDTTANATVAAGYYRVVAN